MLTEEVKQRLMTHEQTQITKANFMLLKFNILHAMEMKESLTSK